VIASAVYALLLTRAVIADVANLTTLGNQSIYKNLFSEQ